jgi:hypothetical protein
LHKLAIELAARFDGSVQEVERELSERAAKRPVQLAGDEQRLHRQMLS